MSVEVKNLSFSYGKHKVLDDISFTVNRGEMLSVLGANGAGKSTLFKCLLNLRSDYEGEIDICHKDIRKVKRNDLSHMIAYIPQSSTPVFNYTVMDTVLMGATGALNLLRAPGREQVEAAEKALELLNIKDLSHRGIGEISGGELQLTLIARALLQRAKVLVMDEPTASLDYGNQHRVLSMARHLADENYTIILSTHNPEHAGIYSTHVMALSKGHIMKEGRAADVINNDFIRELYGISEWSERYEAHFNKR